MIRPIRTTSGNRRGNFLLDYAAVLATIAVLVVACLVAYSGAADRARVEAAQAEVAALGRAQMRVAEAHGVYVPLQTLDDVADGMRADSLANEPDALFAIDASIVAETEAPPAAKPLREAVADWKGPFHHPTRAYIGSATSAPAGWDAVFARRDYPLDPWGNPYRLYTPLGLVGTGAAGGDLDSDTFSDGVVATEEDRFDAYAVVSFGPDGLSDAATGRDDDVIYLFPVSDEGESR